MSASAKLRAATSEISSAMMANQSTGNGKKLRLSISAGLPHDRSAHVSTGAVASTQESLISLTQVIGVNVVYNSGCDALHGTMHPDCHYKPGGTSGHASGLRLIE